MKRRSAMSTYHCPVARHFHHRAAVGIYDGVSQQDGRQSRQSSDGGRSYRYRMAMKRAAVPHTCSASTASCVRNSDTRTEACRCATPRIATPAEWGLCRPLQRQALRRNAEDVTASRGHWSNVSCFRIPAFPMSILTGRELEFLTSLNASWARLYRNELARLLHKVDDRCGEDERLRKVELFKVDALLTS